MLSTELVALELTENRKTRGFVGHRNTFAISSGPVRFGGTCPGATEGPGGCADVCYDCNLKALYAGYRQREERNTLILRNAKTHNDRVDILKNTLLAWWHTTGRLDPFFRIHTGGDFFDKPYVKAWAEVIPLFPKIRFWAYTRSYFAVKPLAKLPNLTLYISADPVNELEAYTVYRQNLSPTLGLAWMGNSLPEGFPTDRKTVVCPSVTKKLKNSPSYGACSRCRVCIDRRDRSGNTMHVQFPIHR